MLELITSSRRVLDDYLVASSVDEALAYLVSHHGQAEVVGGGTSLMLQVQRGDCAATSLVDVSRINALKRVQEQEDALLIGGAVTWDKLLTCACVAAGAPLLCEAGQALGTARLRRLATIAGNVVCAWGNTDGAVALVALEAEAEITNMTGPQWLPVESLYVRNGVSRVNPTAEIVTALHVPKLGPGQGWALERILPAPPELLPPLVLALVLALEPEGRRVAWASLAAGWRGGIPRRLVAVEAALEEASAVPEGVIPFLQAVREALLAADLAFPPEIEPAIGPLAQRAYERALARARQALLPTPR